jgi:C4-dicarboxylate-specific signal transduction histidine kinase
VQFIPKECPPVVSQQVLLTQILNSLFANALEAMPKGGVLSVEIETPQPGQVRMTLNDTGKGMSTQQLQMVFKPFFTTKQGAASGLAWHWSKESWSVFEGSVVLTSREQEGTRVSLNFKVASGGEYGTQHSAGRG